MTTTENDVQPSDEALFKDPPPKEDCPICFRPMPVKLICCVSLPPATILSVPIYDIANENDKLAVLNTEVYHVCCGKSICEGCAYSLDQSGNDEKCPFCNSGGGKTDEENVDKLMKRVDVNDAASICLLATYYFGGVNSCPLDRTKAMELYTRAADLGYSKAHAHLGITYYDGGDLTKAKFHFQAAAMAGHEEARVMMGVIELKVRNMERALKHFTIAASAGHYAAMNVMRTAFNDGLVSQESIDSILEAYNNSCAEMRSEARDTYIRTLTETIESTNNT
jgi:TPR repeat protein